MLFTGAIQGTCSPDLPMTKFLVREKFRLKACYFTKFFFSSLIFWGNFQKTILVVIDIWFFHFEEIKALNHFLFLLFSVLLFLKNLINVLVVLTILLLPIFCSDSCFTRSIYNQSLHK